MSGFRRILIPGMALLLLAACGTAAGRFRAHRDAFFDPEIFDQLALGGTNPDEVRELLGHPFMETESGENRILWVYDFNPARQLVLYFSGGMLVEKGWTLSYPNPIQPERIFDARPELKHLRERPSD